MTKVCGRQTGHLRSVGRLRRFRLPSSKLHLVISDLGYAIAISKVSRLVNQSSKLK